MKCFAKFILLVASLHQLYYSVNSLECRYCNSQDYDSDCRKGTEKNLTTCTLDGEDHCYVEYILNKGEEPLYRRGCAPGNWCDQQVRNHATALKFCKTCQGSKCNDDLIGGNDSNHKLCRKCRSENIYGDCRKGIGLKGTEECAPGETCVYSYVSTSVRHIYERGCGDNNFCRTHKEKYAHSLQSCDSCNEDLCNNDEMKVTYS